ncbi:MAG: hypothetical protein E7437_02825 [Ruminococcaceae bacterium]|nr:hypothetical protein [Oscillospiraceae bacterium]
MGNKLLVGFGDMVITPEEPVPLGGCSFDSSTRFFENIFEDIHGIATAITDAQGNSILFVTMDLVRAYNGVVKAVKEQLSEKLGLGQDRIMVTCTHTHSAPDLINGKEPSIQRYEPWLIEKLVAAGVAAWEDRKPATMRYGKILAPGLNFVKHYQHTLPDGTVKYFGDGFGTPVYDETTEHVDPADPTLRLVQFHREGGKDVVIANFQAHPQLTGGANKKNLSADYPGVFREVLGAQLDCHVHFLQGACGNINPKSRLARENYTVDHRVHGAKLAYYGVRCLEKYMKTAEDTTLKTHQTVFRGMIDHSLDHLADAAREVMAVYDTTKDMEACKRAGEPYGIESYRKAAFILIHMRQPEYYDMELNVISLGEELAMVTAPNELFHRNALGVENLSPYSMTLTCGYANGHYFYVPCRQAYDYGSYESLCSRMFRGTGEQYGRMFLQMLQDLKGTER